MIDNIKWMDDLSEFESRCIGQLFTRNGIITQEDYFKLFHEFNDKKGSGTPEEWLSAIMSIGMERNLLPFPDDLRPGIVSALGKLIKRSFEDDIHSQGIDIERIKKLSSDYLKPMGVDTNYVLSYILNIKSEAVEETISAHSSYWPYPPHKLDALYSQLLQFQLIEPSGQFKAMFLQKDSPLQYRIFWKANRTDLIFLGYRLYYSIFKNEFLEVIDKIFFIKNRRGDISGLRDLKKSFDNIRPDIEEQNLKPKWKSIDAIFNRIRLFHPNE